MAKNNTHPDLIDTAIRRSFVLGLRRAGMTYARIAELAVENFGSDNLPSGWDERYAYKDVMRELEKYRNGLQEDAETIRTLEMERLDRLYQVAYRQATGGSMQAVDRCLRIMERRSKLLGLDLPTEILVGGLEGTPPVREVIIERIKSDDDSS
jgi:hypothetical protein